jgi:hypothetical protein
MRDASARRELTTGSSRLATDGKRLDVLQELQVQYPLLNQHS